MDTSQDMLPLVLLGLIATAVSLIVFYKAQNRSLLIRLVGKWGVYVACFVGFVAFILPYLATEGVVWLAPQSTFGYEQKYNLPEGKVFIDPKPHDCEWEKAPIGKKYCHFEKIVVTDKDPNGKVTAVSVSWEKIND